ncbi:hypothetical protein GCM10027081_57350 [Cupriavidus yeoncheonensis]
MAAPGTPNAVVTPSFSSTAMAASIALIFAMILSPVGVGFPLELILFPQPVWDKGKRDQLIRYLEFAMWPWKARRTVGAHAARAGIRDDV